MNRKNLFYSFLAAVGFVSFCICWISAIILLPKVYGAIVFGAVIFALVWLFIYTVVHTA